MYKVLLSTASPVFIYILHTIQTAPVWSNIVRSDHVRAIGLILLLLRNHQSAVKSLPV